MKNPMVNTEKHAMCKLPFMPHDIARHKFFALLEKLNSGSVTVVESGDRFQFGKPGDLNVTISINKPTVYSDLVFGGTLGAGEAFIRGDWTVDNLTDLMRLICRDFSIVNAMDSNLAMLVNPILRVLHRLRRNTLGGSRQNIHEHYDLGNDFFGLFLDESLMYSAAIFPNEDSTLHEAQLNKLKIICDKLQLKPTDHLIEIGTGWGALAIYAVENYGCRVTTATISAEQAAMAGERIKAKGLENQITLVNADYRELTGEYDKLVSVEMIEAVGHKYLPLYFEVCSRLLKPDGLFLLQLIAVPGRRYDQARRQIDFIKRYIFPGSCIPSIQRVMDCVERKTDLRLLDHCDYSPHYARTLKAWRENLMKHQQEIEEKTSPDFFRMWLFYLSYCEGGFAEYFVGSAQMVLAKPYNRTHYSSS